jgi:hypothetical protein
MCGSIPPLLQYSFMARCLLKHRDNFNFTFHLSSLYHRCVSVMSDYGQCMHLLVSCIHGVSAGEFKSVVVTLVGNTKMYSHE